MTLITIKINGERSIRVSWICLHDSDCFNFSSQVTGGSYLFRIWQRSMAELKCFISRWWSSHTESKTLMHKSTQNVDFSGKFGFALRFWFFRSHMSTAKSDRGSISIVDHCLNHRRGSLVIVIAAFSDRSDPVIFQQNVFDGRAIGTDDCPNLTCPVTSLTNVDYASS